MLSPQAHSSHLETNPAHARGETTPKLPFNWAWSLLCRAGPERVLQQYFVLHGKAHREVPARGVGVATAEPLLTPQGKALLEDSDPCCRRARCMLAVGYFQGAILLIHNLLNCPRSVQRWCVVDLASGEESCNCRQRLGQWASWFLVVLSRRWIHLNQDVDTGSQRQDIENVEVVVFVFRALVRKVQKLKGKECTAGRQIRQGHVRGERNTACCTSAMLREEVALGSTARKFAYCSANI